jgi:hypothetical protein
LQKFTLLYTHQNQPSLGLIVKHRWLIYTYQHEWAWNIKSKFSIKGKKWVKLNNTQDEIRNTHVQKWYFFEFLKKHAEKNLKTIKGACLS